MKKYSDFYSSSFFINKTKKEKCLFILFEEKNKLNTYGCLGVLGEIGVLGVSDTQNTQNTQNTRTPAKKKVIFSGTDVKLIRKYLDDYEKKGLLIKDKSKNPIEYKISPEGDKHCKLELEEHKNKLKDLEKQLKIKEEIRAIEEDYEKQKEISNTFIKQYLFDYKQPNSSDLVIDWKYLVEKADPEVLDFLLDHYDEFIDILKLEYQHSEQYLENKKERSSISLINFPDSKKLLRLKDIRETDSIINQSEAEIQYKSGIEISTYEVKFECPACGNLITTENNFLDDKINIPKSCGCGRKGAFIELDRKDIEYQKVKLKDLDVNLLAGEYPVDFDSVILNDLALNILKESQFNISDKIKIIYKTRKHYKQGETRPIKYIEILDMQHLEKIDFKDKFSEEQRNEFESFAKEKESLTRFSDSCFYRHTGDELAKYICCLQLFTETKIENHRNYFHVFLVGDPGTGKTTNFLNEIPKLFSRCEKIDSESNTKAGLLVGSKKDDFLGKHIAEMGALPKANNGYLLIDELNDMDIEFIGCLPQAMEVGEINSQKLGARGTFPARFRVLASCNPKNDKNKLDPDIPVHLQSLKLPGKLIDRFDFIIPFLKNTDVEKAYDDIFGTVSEKKREVKEDFLRQYILYAQNFNPYFNKKVLAKYSNEIQQCASDEMKVNHQSEHRLIVKLKNLIFAVARFRLHNEVTESDIKEALDIYKKYIYLHMQFLNEHTFEEQQV